MRLKLFLLLPLLLWLYWQPALAQEVDCGQDEFSETAVQTLKDLYDADYYDTMTILYELDALLTQALEGCLENIPDYRGIPSSRTEDGAYVLGDPDAPITIVQFADVLCGHCRDYKSVIDQFIEEFVMTGEARFEYRFLPTQDDSLFAFQLLQCTYVLRPGAFWYAYDRLYDLVDTDTITSDVLLQFTREFALDTAVLSACLPTAEQSFVDQELADDLEVQGAPTVFVRYGYGPIQPLVIDGFVYNSPPIEILRLIIESRGDNS